jgi:hypothetical protein
MQLQLKTRKDKNNGQILKLKKKTKYCAVICNPHYSTPTNPTEYKFLLKKERTKCDTTTNAPAIGYLA